MHEIDIRRVANSALFHYWNCGGDCGKFRHAMAELAKVVGYTDPAVDDEIEEALKEDRE